MSCLIPPTPAGAHFVPTVEKRPVYRNWPETRLSLTDAEQRLAAGRNVATRLGPASGDLVDVDLDCSEALVLADLYLPPTGAGFGRASKQRSHRLYRFRALSSPASSIRATATRCSSCELMAATAART
jgi:hypothetical protein